MPRRSTPVLAATSNETVPLPLPPAPAAIQADWLDTVHAHPALVATCTGTRPPAAPTLVLVVVTVKRHGAGSCSMEIWSSLTTIAPRRADRSGFGSTRKSTVPPPWPVAPDVIAIHAALLDADHVQSRVVSTVTVPEAPLAGADPIELVAATSHFGALGAATLTDEDPHAAAAAPIAIAATTDTRRRTARPYMATAATVQARCLRVRRVLDDIARQLDDIDELIQTRENPYTAFIVASPI